MSSNPSPYQPPRSAITPNAPIHFGEVKIFSARGRLGRVRYIGYSVGLMLLTYLAIAVLGGIAAVLGGGDGDSLSSLGGDGPMGLLMMGAIVVPVLLSVVASLLIAIQRLHDFNASGWWVLLMIVPFANLILYLVLLIMPGTQGPNRFDHPPPPNSIGVILLALILPLIFVLGILAAIAIPAYSDYVSRAKAIQQQQQQQPAQ